MNALEDMLRLVTELFARQCQAWALVGGLAVSVRAEPRFTRDVDLAVAVPDDAAAEALVHQLRNAGFRTQAVLEQNTTGRLATARLALKEGRTAGLMLDLLFASSGIEPEICQSAESLDVFPALSVPVARLHHLLVLKVLARDDRTRPQDAADIRALGAAARPEDLRLARDAAQLVTQRGFNRSRDLSAALTEAWETFGGSRT